MMIWWTKKDSQSQQQQEAAKRTPQTKTNSARRILTGSDRKRSKKKLDGSLATAVSDESMCLATTTSGIEISLPDRIGGLKGTPAKMNDRVTAAPMVDASAKYPFASVRHVLLERRKVHRAQFAIREWKDKSGRNITPLPIQKPATPKSILSGFQPRAHRIPLFGAALNNLISFQDAIALLRRHEVNDELECVQKEITMLDLEIAALREDQDDINEHAMSLVMSPSSAWRHSQTLSALQWDAHKNLLTKDSGEKDRMALQETRGVSLTIVMQNQRALEVLISRFGCKETSPKNLKSGIFTISPQNCREGGAGLAIQHINLLKGSSEASFFASKDNGKSFCHGRLPDRLFRRMHARGLDPRDANELLYLPTGPNGSYYAEFRSGECWWGSSVDENEDSDFFLLCREWNIRRVSFGPCVIIEDGHGRSHRAMSWIIISQDGRVAWKNIPSRLQRTLEERMSNEAAPVEVSLGYADSYFVRFLDGAIDYCLPARIADVIESRRLDVTAIYMHPELPDDFIIRHR